MINKLYISAVIILSVFCASVFAQSQKGLYPTATDFSHKKLSHQFKQGYVKTHEVVKKGRFGIMCNDGTYTRKNYSVYSYRSNEGIDYRVAERNYYSIKNSGENILISKWLEDPEMKGGSPDVHCKGHASFVFAELENLETVY